MKFKWQKDRKAETNQKILHSLSRNPSTFTNLLASTELSKAILSKTLKEMLKQELLEKFVAVDGSVQYRLMGKAAQRALVYLRLAEFIASAIPFFDDLGEMATDPKINMERFLNELGDKIAASALYGLISTLTIQNTHEAEVWLESTFAQPDHRKEWLYYLMKRAAFEAKKEVIMKFGDLYNVERILENVPRNMVQKMWVSYKKMYPVEAKILDDAMHTADRYTNVLRRLQKGELDMKDIEKLPLREVLEKYG